MKNKSGVLAVVLLVGILSTVAYALNQVFTTHVTQPVQFDHKLHTDPEGAIGLSCSDCHLYYKTQRNSGRPSLSTCTDCHQIEETDKPELKKLMAAVRRGPD
jgi:Zn finger protein HypA/HybF involved in hydrogenase expression